MSTIYALGTSITVGASTDSNPPFVSTLCQETGFKEMNLGVAGATVGKEHHQNADIWNPQETLGAIESRARSLKFVNFKKGDIVMLECINDFRVSISTASFKQGLVNSIEHIKSNTSFTYPDNKIYLFVSHQFRSTGVNRPGCEDRNLYNTPLLDYINIIKSMEIKYNFVKVINMYGLFEPTDKYVYDGVHLSELGKRKYIDEIKPIIGRGDSDMNTGANKRKIVAYIPLDDRPCNKDRIQLAAQAMGIGLLIPDKNYYKTCLDNQPKNTTGSQIGSPDNIVNWLQKVSSENQIDAYLISLDQLNSGGLVGSRSIKNPSSNIDKEKTRLERVFSIINGKPVYFFDTVMRLATTLGFEGSGQSDYDNFRAYGAEPRKPQYAMFEDVRFNDIIKGYNLDKSGNVISPSRFGLTQDQVNKYLLARERKFKLNVEFGKMMKLKPNASIVYGVDDSQHEETIQKNEIDFLRNYIVSKEKVFAGADELAISLLSKLVSDMYCKYNKPKVKVTYFGGGENLQADGFSFHPLKYGVETNVVISGGELVNSKPFDIELLVLTKPANGKTLEQNANDLHYELNQNLTNNVLTSVIDASENDRANAHLQRRLLGDYGKIEITKLLSYSNWNTVGNTIGMALGHAIGRCSFLKLGWNDRIRESLEGQVKLLFTEFAKDVCYQIGAKWGVDSYLMQYVDQEDSIKLTNAQRQELPNNFYKYGVDQYLPWNDWKKNCLLWASYYYMVNGDFNIHKLAKIFYTNGYAYETYLAPNDCALTQINWINYPYENGDSAWFKLEYPWHRTFECTFPINVSFK